MPALVLGPLLRYCGPDGVTVWVQTDVPCRVEVLGARAETFSVGSRHHAVVTADAPAVPTPYAVRLDGAEAWPGDATWRAPAPLRPPPGPDRAAVAIGSCRVSPPPRTPGGARHGPDALAALARRVAAQRPEDRPDMLLLVGDQVYVDHPAGARPHDYAGHAAVYERAWRDPAVRWLLSAVPSAMILDDHEVVNGWSPAAAVSAAQADRVAAALAAYWVYQHLGNLSPAALRDDPLLTAVAAAADGLPVLMDAARRWARGEGRFGHARRVGPARLVVMDARGRRVARPDPPRRSMLDPAAWRRLDARLRGDAAHLVLVSSVPVYMQPGLRDLEAWAGALGDGAWGRPGRRLARRLRRGFGLEHWPADGDSLGRLGAMLAEVTAGRRGAPPASVIVASGEVHHGRVARVRLRDGDPRVPVWQVVSSPLRNPLGRRQRVLLRVADTAPFRAAMRLTARTAGVRPPGDRVVGASPPVFANHVALLMLDGRRARVRVEAAVAGPGGRVSLRTVAEHRLA